MQLPIGQCYQYPIGDTLNYRHHVDQKLDMIEKNSTKLVFPAAIDDKKIITSLTCLHQFKMLFVMILH